MNHETERIEEQLRDIREVRLPEIHRRLRGVDERLISVERPGPQGTPSEVEPVEADVFFESLSRAVTAAQHRLSAEQSGDTSYAIGTVKADIAAHLELAEDGKVRLYLPVPGSVVHEMTLAKLEFAMVPVRPVPDDAAEVLVPRVVGQPLELAERQLVAAGLEVGAIKHEERPAGDGIVVAQWPSGDATLVAGDAVQITVARATHVMVPTLVGMPVDDAIRLLEAADLRRRVARKELAGMAPGTVIEQEPQGGQEVERRTVVRLSATPNNR